MTDLREIAESWKRWAEHAAADEPAWASSFPGWTQLVEATCQTMRSPFKVEELPDVEMVWQITEETEDIIDCCRSHTEAAREWIAALAHSAHAEVRWQIYELLRTERGEWAHRILREGINDLDPYARRRAFLSLVAHATEDRSSLIARFLADPDEYNRHVAARIGPEQNS